MQGRNDPGKIVFCERSANINILRHEGLAMQDAGHASNDHEFDVILNQASWQIEGRSHRTEFRPF